MEAESCSSAVNFFFSPERDARFFPLWCSGTGRNAQECNMEGCSCVMLIHFARSHTVSPNSCTLALQLALICIAAEVTPVNVSKNGFIYQQ